LNFSITLIFAFVLYKLHFVVAPVGLSEGIPIFTGKPKVSLKFIDAQTTKDAGNVIFLPSPIQKHGYLMI
jgi:hypothetical protein